MGGVWRRCLCLFRYLSCLASPEVAPRVALTSVEKQVLCLLHKQLPHKIKTRLVIIEYAGYVSWQLFLRRL